jgi:hypothetical protein
MIPEIESLSATLNSRVNTKRIALNFPSDSSFVITSTVDDTFPIEVSYRDGKYTVGVDEWHGHFAEEREASAVVTWLLTPYYRIVQSEKNGEAIATWLEIYTDSGWEGTEYVYFVDPNTISSPAENADQIHIRQQAIFLDSAFTTHFPGAHLDEAGYPLGTILGKTAYQRRDDGWYPIGVPDAE